MPERRNPAAAPPSADPHPRDLKRVSADLRELVASLRTDRDRHTHAAHPSDLVQHADPEPSASASASPSPSPSPSAARAAPPRPLPLPAERGEGRGDGPAAPAARPKPPAREPAAAAQPLAAATPATAAPLPAAPVPSAAEIADLDRRRLAAELTLAREGAAHAAAERDLTKRIDDLEAENRRLTDQYVAAQERATDVAQRYVALERIHGGLTRGETLSAIQEIVINVVGSEELAILEVRGDRLELVQSFGIDPEPWRDLPVTDGPLARAAAGATWIAGRDEGPDAGNLSACLPLRAGDRVIGVLAIFRLLGHKPGFGEADHAMFELLSTHAGLALHVRPASQPQA